jgi:hypothetical protein
MKQATRTTMRCISGEINVLSNRPFCLVRTLTCRESDLEVKVCRDCLWQRNILSIFEISRMSRGNYFYYHIQS